MGASAEETVKSAAAIGIQTRVAEIQAAESRFVNTHYGSAVCVRSFWHSSSGAIRSRPPLPSYEDVDK
jgi:hypothetical protein